MTNCNIAIFLSRGEILIPHRPTLNGKDVSSCVNCSCNCLKSMWFNLNHLPCLQNITSSSVNNGNCFIVVGMDFYQHSVQYCLIHSNRSRDVKNLLELHGLLYFLAHYPYLSVPVHRVLRFYHSIALLIVHADHRMHLEIEIMLIVYKNVKIKFLVMYIVKGKKAHLIILFKLIVNIASITSSA